MNGAQEFDNVVAGLTPFFDHMHKLGKIQELKEDLKNATAKRCGNCDLWMKSTCRPEKELGQFKSCSSFSCGSFSRDKVSQELKTKYETELEQLNKKGGE